jgi:tetratricopeptide (TPR) repeat protein
VAQKQPVKKKQLPNDPQLINEQVKQDNAAPKSNKWLPYIIIFIFSCLLYSNTLQNKYAIDDTIVLTDNTFTKKGFSGIKDIMTHDAFVGFFGDRGSQLVSGGRYRPLSMVTFAIEYELYGMTPAYSHAINIIMFALCCISIYYLLLLILPPAKDRPFYLSIAFIATLLYAAHPIHTEAVANIKGRDEIMGMWFSMLALIAAVKYVKTQNALHLIWGFVIYVLALLSKENSITFFAIIPLTYFMFTKAKAKEYALTLGLYFIAVVIFMALRTQYTAATIGAESPEVLNNPFRYVSDPVERYATIILTFLYYIKLMIFPHPLTHDYYYNQIPYVGADNILFILSFLVNGALVVYALINLPKKTIPSYAILFYFITFSIVSNLLFTVGVLMNERFIFMSSLGFCLLVAYLLIKAIERYKIPANAIAGVVALILVLYSTKTFTRNFDWKDNFTLFSRDVRWSPNSAKIQTSLGGDLIKEADAQTDSIKRLQILNESVQHLNEALRIYPTHSNAWLLLGNAMFKQGLKLENVIPVYRNALTYHAPGYYDGNYNLGFVYLQSNQPDSAIKYLYAAYTLKPEAVSGRLALADAYYKAGKGDSAIIWYNKVLELSPDDANIVYKIGTTYGKVMGNLPAAIPFLEKATKLNPKVELYWEDLGVAYGLSGRFLESIEASKKLLEVNPRYPAAYTNIIVSYRNMNDNANAAIWEQKFRQAMGQAQTPAPQ